VTGPAPLPAVNVGALAIPASFAVTVTARCPRKVAEPEVTVNVTYARDTGVPTLSVTVATSRDRNAVRTVAD
jgi:hypothetical protein